ncbi:multiple inositol polyphosphate phosphatase 1-like [Aricia agestis]|uniref:multiple inositol polyphosphate phosphatase 1-like n=1 Tax=Aricia agestis TaxID=91739 RepID=UPI001C202F26|nr:multiple inositol polyphosphate phosphatase 1-like [Aricia agestis]
MLIYKMFTPLIFIFVTLFGTLYANILQTNDIRNYLSTRTPYRFKYNTNESQIIYPGCEAKKVWMLLRHGTRQPSTKDINNINIKLKDLKLEILSQNIEKVILSKEQLKIFENWDINLSPEEQKFLTYEGQDEMILTAERMQKRFPKIITEEYSNKTYQFRYTAKQRTQQSARYFSLGLFDKKVADEIIFDPPKKVDTTLRFYKHCDKWQKQVKKNPDTYKEQRLFGISQKMNETLESVSQRLGLDRVLSLDAVVLMYKTCGFETAWHKHFESPWCYAFDLNSIKDLEYYHDLRNYWLDGYGHELTYHVACMILKDMFQFVSNNEGPKATFLFAHSGTLLKLLTHLQLYKPEVPLSADYIDDGRPFKTSDIDCFASNLAFVLYECGDKQKMLTLHQEKIVKLPMCDNELCPLEHLKKYFHDSIHKCDFDEMCSIN